MRLAVVFNVNTQAQRITESETKQEMKRETNQSKIENKRKRREREKNIGGKMSKQSHGYAVTDREKIVYLIGDEFGHFLFGQFQL